MKSKFLLVLLLVMLISPCFTKAQWTSQYYSVDTLGVNSVFFVNDTVGFNIEKNYLNFTPDGIVWFTLRSNLTVNGPYDLYFINEDIGFIIGDDNAGNFVIKKTTDGGMSWDDSTLIPSRFPGDHPVRINFINNTNGFMTVENSKTIYKTTNQGLTWEPDTVVRIGSYSDFINIHFIDGVHGHLTSNINNTYFKTEDAGATWTEHSIPGASSLQIFDLYFLSEDTGFAACSQSTIYRTVNGGLSWMAVYAGDLSDNLLRVHFTSSTIGYAIGTSGNILATTNRGNTWTAQQIIPSDTNYTLTCMSFPSQQIGFIGGSINPYDVNAHGILLKTTNGGGVFAQVEETPIMQKFLWSIYPNPASTEITVQFDAIKNSTSSQLIITDLRGRELKNIGITDTQTRINVKDLTNGMYFVYLSIANKKTQAQKLLINK